MSSAELNPSPLSRLDRWRAWLAGLPGGKAIGFVRFCVGLGGLVIFTYLLGLQFLPNFTVGDLLGMFGAAFLLGILVIGVLTLYCLMPGWVTRQCVDAMESSWLSAAQSGGTRAVVLPASPGYRSLTHGGYIVLATLLAGLAWALFFTETLRVALGNTFWVGAIAYGVMVAAALSSLYAFGQSTRTKLSKAAASAAVGAFVCLLILLALSTPGTVTAPVTPVRTATRPWLFHSLERLGIWLTDQGAWLAPLCGTLVCALVFWVLLRPSHPRPPRISLSPAARYDCIKGLAAIVFLSFSALPLILAMSYAQMGSSDRELSIFVNIFGLLAVANWIVFTHRNLRQVLSAACFAAVLLFFFAPIIVGRPLLLSEMVVRGLGLGGIHLESITLAGKHCATLAGHGARCEANADQALQLTDVNLLSRIGSSVLLEIQAKPATVEDKLGDNISTTPNAPTTLHAASSTPSGARTETGCDEIILSRSQRNGPTTGVRLHCLRIVVPAGDVLSYIPNGARRYTSELSRARMIGGAK